MGQWSLIGCLVGALAGAVVFLALVADEVRCLERDLQLRKLLEAEQRARRHAQEMAAR